MRQRARMERCDREQGRKEQNRTYRLIAGFTAVLFAALALLGASCPVEATESRTAETIRIAGTLGTVTAKDRNNKKLSTDEGMRLTSGCTVTTGANSYAWLNLDDTKALKLDAETEVLITKYKTNLDVTVNKGSVLFDVSQKLTEQENYHIRSANMVMGIRGTIGYVTKTGPNSASLALLEGTAHAQVTDQVTGTVTEGDVTAGQIVDTDALASQHAAAPAQNTPNGQPGALIYRKLTKQMIPEYILAEAAAGNAADAGRTRFGRGSGVFSGRIFDACGIDLRGLIPEDVKAPSLLNVEKKKDLLKAWAAFDEELKRLAREEEEKRIAEQASDDEDEEGTTYNISVLFSDSATAPTSTLAYASASIRVNGVSASAAKENDTVEVTVTTTDAYYNYVYYIMLDDGTTLFPQSGQGSIITTSGTGTFTMPARDVSITAYFSHN